jgi:cell division transport system ATP-binding protein
MLEFKNVTKRYKDLIAIDNISLEISKGEFVFLVGPNGAGKSTLLELIYCEEHPTKGQIIFDGMDLTNMRRNQVPKARRKMGIIFQDYKLLPNYTVKENIEFALRVVGTKKNKIIERVNEVLDIVDMHHRKDYYPEQLSGGEQQRTAIGRALANWPKIIMADEPTGNLDPMITEIIMGLFSKINDTGTTVLMATHDLNVVKKMKKRVITLNKGKVISDDAQGGFSLVL